MSEKRKDNKGRILRDGESQRKDGRYEYKFVDKNGNRRSVYSWRLVETDKNPQNTRQNLPLRAIEKNINKDLLDGIDFVGSQSTIFNDIFGKYYSINNHLKRSTWINYRLMYDKHVRNGFGMIQISNIKYSDVKTLYLDMLTKKKLSFGAVTTINNMIHPVLEFAVREELIRSNPSNGVLAEIRKQLRIVDPHKCSMTEDEQVKLIRYVTSCKQFMFMKNLIIVMLGTGMRIGEVISLTIDDCDMDECVIHVKKTMTYNATPGNKCERHITSPKSAKSIRDIPMLSKVKDALLDQCSQREMILYRLNEQDCDTIDGVRGFIFCNSKGVPFSSQYVNKTLHRIVEKYNSDEDTIAEKHNRQPQYLPNITSHTFRHSFCTRLCENVQDIKVVQEVMGHTRASTTLDAYTESTLDKKKINFSNIDGKIPLA